MRWWCVLLVAVTSLVSGDPDLRQLLHIWRPTPALTWSNVTQECAQAMDTFSLALSQRQQWASLMLDATGPAETQYLQNSNFWLGSRPECEQVNDQYALNASNSFPTAVYSVLKLKVNVSEPLVAPQLTDHVEWLVPRHIWMGICLPGACGDAAQVSALLRQMLDAAQDESNFRDVQLVKVKILPSDFSVWGESSTSLLILLSVLFIWLALIGTGLDYAQLKIEDGKISWHSILLAFSLRSNARNLFNTSASKTNVTFPALHGMRVFTMMWIIVAHLCIYIFVFGENPSFRTIAEQNFLFQILMSGNISVDTFFFISGVLLTYILLNMEKGKQKDSLLQASFKFFYIFMIRTIRLLLPYIFTILIVTVSFRQLNADSIFDSEMPETKNCPQNAWRNLLFINNFYHGSDMCITWGWYLAADTQLYLVAAALLLVYINGYPRAATVAGSSILLASWVTIAGVMYHVANLPEMQQPEVMVDMLFNKPWMHTGAMFVGIVTGRMLQQGADFNISKSREVVGWTCCLSGMFVTVFLERWLDYLHPVVILLLFTFKTTIWSVCLAWVLLMCVHNRAGCINQLLELPIFLPFGRATYCTYLLHLPLMEWVFLNLDGPQIISRGMTTILGIGFVMASYVIGMVTSLLFESPVIRLLALLRAQREKYDSPELGPQLELEEKENDRIVI